MRFATMVALGALLAACGNAEADANGAQVEEPASAQASEVETQNSWLAFADRDKCELGPKAAGVVEAMMRTEREGEPYGMLVAKPASATLPGGKAPIRAVALADEPYQMPGIFLPLEEDWNGLPLRGLWANAAIHQALAENMPYDGVEIRLYFDDAPDLADRLNAAGWTLSELDPAYGDPMPAAIFTQQYYPAGKQELLDKPLDDYDAAAKSSPSGIPKVDGREVGSYGMNTIVQLVESSAKPGMTYLTCNIYAST